MAFQILEMLWYSIVFFVAGSWLMSQLVPEDVPPAFGRILGIALLSAALVVGYLIAFEKGIELDCRPPGPGIYNDC